MLYWLDFNLLTFHKCWLHCFSLVLTTDLEAGTLRTKAPEIVGNENVCPSNSAFLAHCHAIVATGSPASYNHFNTLCCHSIVVFILKLY